MILNFLKTSVNFFIQFILPFIMLLCICLILISKTANAGESAILLKKRTNKQIYKWFPEMSFREAAVKIKNKEASCSGFIINKNKVITAAHCIPHSMELIEVTTEKNKKLKVITLDKIDKDKDYVILTIENSGINILKLDCSVAHNSLFYFVLGYPRAVRKATIKTLFNTGLTDSSDMIHMIGAVDFGNSGSMVIDKYGNVIGLVSEISHIDTIIHTGVVSKYVFCSYFKE